MTEWHYAVNRQKYGPVPLAEVRRLIALKVITPATLVWREGLEKWLPAGQVQELFPESAGVSGGAGVAPRAAAQGAVGGGAVGGGGAYPPRRGPGAMNPAGARPAGNAGAGGAAYGSAAGGYAAPVSAGVMAEPAGIGSGGSFAVKVTSDSAEIGNGDFVCGLLGTGATLTQGERIVAIPIGSPVEYDGGKHFTVRLQTGTALVRVGIWTKFSQKLTGDVVAFLQRRGAMPAVERYNIPWYFYVLILLPLGLPVISLGNVLAIFLALTVAGGCAALVWFERWPQWVRLAGVAGINVLSYMVVILAMVVAFVMRPRLPQGEAASPSPPAVVVMPGQPRPVPPPAIQFVQPRKPEQPAPGDGAPTASEQEAKLRAIEKTWRVHGGTILDILQDMKQSGSVLRDGDGNVVLTEGGRITSKATYTVPVTFRIVAQTSSTNIRIGYAADQIILNWEMRPDELRIDGGPPDGHHKAGAGLVPMNQWVGIELSFNASTMVLWVDGEERQRVTADFTKVRDPLSLWTMYGSKMKVNSVGVMH